MSAHSSRLVLQANAGSALNQSASVLKAIFQPITGDASFYVESIIRSHESTLLTQAASGLMRPCKKRGGAEPLQSCRHASYSTNN